MCKIMQTPQQLAFLFRSLDTAAPVPVWGSQWYSQISQALTFSSDQISQAQTPQFCRIVAVSHPTSIHRCQLSLWVLMETTHMCLWPHGYYVCVAGIYPLISPSLVHMQFYMCNVKDSWYLVSSLTRFRLFCTKSEQANSCYFLVICVYLFL